MSNSWPGGTRPRGPCHAAGASGAALLLAMGAWPAPCSTTDRRVASGSRKAGGPSTPLSAASAEGSTPPPPAARRAGPAGAAGSP